jgi:hypothetical protein
MGLNLSKGNLSKLPASSRTNFPPFVKEIKQLYANTPNSFDRTASILKGKSYYTDFIEASYIKTDAPDEVNSITKSVRSTNRDYPTFKVNVFGLKYPI